MEHFFSPKSVALVGASANPLKGGYSILKNLLTGFEGDIFPINPRYEEIDGIACYPSIDDIPGQADLAIVFIPAPAAVKAVKACAEKGIQSIMIQSAGFAETGEEGRALQEELLEIKEAHGVRIWGPNCMGLVDAVNRHVFSFVLPSIWDDGLMPGKVSLIVQSGMLSAGFLIDMVSHGTMGISKACSIGNKADVDECDILEYLIDDPDTHVIGAYLESIRNGRRFFKACRKSRKPIVVLKGGKSAKGAQAAMSHTASLAGNGAIISGALAQAGVIEADDFKQMLDLCRTLAMDGVAPQPGKGRVAVLTYSGGAGIVSADFIDALGLETATLSTETLQQLQTVFPDWMPPANPVDLWPAVEKNGPDKVYRAAFEAMSRDPNVDAILYHLFVGGQNNADTTELADIAQKGGKPVFCWLMGRRQETLDSQLHMHGLGIPTFRELRRAVECMAVYFQYYRSTVGIVADIGESSPVIPNNPDLIPAGESGVLDEYRSKQILSTTGIPTVAEAVVATPEEAAERADEFGYPIVLKGLSSGRIHKTEENLVRLGISGKDAVSDAFISLETALSGDGKILVQKQIAGAPELIAGLVRDPQFGPCVMCGFGGIMAEVLNDTAFAVAPLSMEDALALIDRLKTQKLLNGFRGSPPLNRKAFAEILVKLGDLGPAYSRIREIDINPFIVSNGQPIAVDATIIVDE